MALTLRTAQQYLDKLRKEFDGADSFGYRIYENRIRSYTVDEFLKLRPRSLWSDFTVVCRDGFGWRESPNGTVLGFWIPWNVPGPGEVIKTSLHDQVKDIMCRMSEDHNGCKIMTRYDEEDILDLVSE